MSLVAAGRSALLGAALAILAVALVAAAFAMHVLPVSPPAAKPPSTVALALVLPAADGANAPRVIDVYVETPSGWTVRSVSPTTPADIPGTSASTLADAYSFGGGKGLASALAANPGIPVDAWVIVNEAAWLQLHGHNALSIELPSDVEVFDGSRLYSYADGTTSVPAEELPQLLQGAAYLSAGGDESVRGQVGGALAKALEGAGGTGVAGVATSMPQATLQDWLSKVSSAKRIPGT